MGKRTLTFTTDNPALDDQAAKAARALLHAVFVTSAGPLSGALGTSLSDELVQYLQDECAAATHPDHVRVAVSQVLLYVMDDVARRNLIPDSDGETWVEN